MGVQNNKAHGKTKEERRHHEQQAWLRQLERAYKQKENILASDKILFYAVLDEHMKLHKSGNWIQNLIKMFEPVIIESKERL